MTLALLGEGEMLRDGKRVPAADALAKAGIVPLRLAAKEGLALINGTQPPPRWRCTPSSPSSRCWSRHW